MASYPKRDFSFLTNRRYSELLYTAGTTAIITMIIIIIKIKILIIVT
jgi:hypothetical protein